MDGIKESLARVVELAKKHPAIAGLLVLVAVVLGYFAYKKNAVSDTGEELAQDGAIGQDISSESASGEGSGGSLFSSFLSGGEASPVEASSVTPSWSGGGGGGDGGSGDSGGYGGGYENMENSYIPPAGSGYVPYTPAVGMSGEAQSTLPSATIEGHSEGGMSAAAVKKSDNVPGAGSVQSVKKAVFDTVKTVLPASASQIRADVKKEPVKLVDATKKLDPPKKKPGTSTATPTATKTDAEKVGAPKKYSGLWLGKRYLNGMLFTGIGPDNIRYSLGVKQTTGATVKVKPT